MTANIRAAIDAGLHIRLAVVPSAAMLPWVDRIMEYAGTFGADDVLVNPMLVEANPDTGRCLEDFGLSLEENDRIYRKSLELFPIDLSGPKEEEAESAGGIPENRPHIEPRGLPCNGGRTIFAIHWDGTMGPCLNFPRDVICADAKKTGFEAAWLAVNRGVKDYTIPEACHTCSHKTGCHYCPPQHKSLAAKHLCDSAACAWRKRQADIVEEYRKKQRHTETVVSRP